MNIFISGGAGFIGSHLVTYFLNENNTNRVVIYDNFSSGSINHINNFLNNPNFIIFNEDIKNLDKLIYAMNGINLVIHLAANPDIAKAVNQPDIDFWEGTYLTQNILEAMRINKVPEILYTSGSGVYGEVSGVNFSESFGPLFPISTYGASKLACESLISSYCHMFGIRGRAFRFANVVGPKQTHGVGYDFIRRLLTNPTELRILGDGTQTKSYIHVDDVIAAMLIALENMKKEERKLFDVFNVATDDYISVTSIANIACEIAGLNPSSVKYLYTGGDRGWKGDVPCVLFDVTKIKSLGWRSVRSSQIAIRDSIESMKLEVI
jgi:UDP-glucose 4-epimerase